MTQSENRQIFDARCDAVAARVASLGVTLAKSSPGAHELHVFADSASVVFPILTDDADWEQLSAAEAFYVALLDAKAWQNVRLDEETTAQFDEAERISLPLIEREASIERDRLFSLARVLGGRSTLDALLADVT
jgi:hypothetical protein